MKKRPVFRVPLHLLSKDPPSKTAFCTWCKNPCWVYQPECSQCSNIEDTQALTLFGDDWDTYFNIFGDPL